MIHRHRALCLVLLVCTLPACDRRGDAPPTEAHAGEPAAAPTNRVEIPAPVRTNLGITFARVEYRNVERTLRIPGRFELLPTARREYRTPLPGRIELLVGQYDRVEPGAALYGVESAAWRDLHERIASMEAKVRSMGPLREAHRVHEQSLADKVALWQDRLRQLEELRDAGGGSASLLTEARDTINATRAELADVMEKDAELEAEQQQAEAELRSLRARVEILHRGAHPPGEDPPLDPASRYVVHAVAPGVVEQVSMTPGELGEEGSLVLTMVQPEQIRFHARALQSDLGVLRDGLPARVVPAMTRALTSGAAVGGVLRFAPVADPDDRTVSLFVEGAAPSWALAGVAAHVEVTLEGGREELAIPRSAVVYDGLTPVIFRRDPANPDRAIRMEADLGVSDGRYIVIASGVKEGDEVVLDGNYQLMLATSGSAAKGGHFHADGTFHEGED